jgi:alpha-tubulin suppressor-like RCC1 family protein
MQVRSVRLSRILLPVFAATFVAGCEESLTSGPRIATLVIVAGTGQSGPIGSLLGQAFTVRVVDQAGDPLAGVLVSWDVLSGGGSVSPDESTTDAAGEASAFLTLGTTVGTNTVAARLDQSTAIVFSATATSASASRLVAAAGNAQTGVVGSQLGQDLVVRVSDALDNPKSGVTVSFAVISGGGTLSAATATSDALGVARVRWTLGATLGTQTVLASVAGTPPVTLTATAIAAAPENLVAVSQGATTGRAGDTLHTALRVRAEDRFGNPVSGIAVTWTPAAGSGSVVPGTSVTDASGIAVAKWVLGGSGGAVQVTASAGGQSLVIQGGVVVNYSSVSAGGRSTCGISTDNVMLCWGYNGEGQLGLGQSAGSGPLFALPQPTGTAGGHTFRQASVNLYHGCGITLASVGYCWGVNHDGRLGDNTIIAKNAPVQLFSPVSLRMLAVSRNHSCGLSLGDRIFCWGYALDGQTGTGAPPPAPNTFLLVPTEVGGDPSLRFQALVSGGQHSCGLTTTMQGTDLYCWGYNGSGQIGDGTLGTALVPVAVAGGLGWLDVPAPVAGQHVALTIAAGYDHTCALAGTGAYCWGRNTRGQLGDGSTAIRTVPTLVTGSGALAFRSIAAGESHTCAVTDTGVLYCWGSNANGQLGDGTTTDRLEPTLVALGLPFRSVSAGDQHTCAVTTTNLLYCWGDNQYGQLGVGAALQGQPVRVPTKVVFQP